MQQSDNRGLKDIQEGQGQKAIVNAYRSIKSIRLCRPKETLGYLGKESKDLARQGDGRPNKVPT